MEKRGLFAEKRADVRCARCAQVIGAQEPCTVMLCKHGDGIFYHIACAPNPLLGERASC